MIWTMVVIAAALAFPLPGALLLIDGTRKKCPSCGRLWARTLANTSYTKLVPTNEYLNWKVFFDNHIVGFAPEAAIPRPGSPKVIQVYTCRYCREPFSKLPGDAQPRLSLVLKLGGDPVHSLPCGPGRVDSVVGSRTWREHTPGDIRPPARRSLHYSRLGRPGAPVRRKGVRLAGRRGPQGEMTPAVPARLLLFHPDWGRSDVRSPRRGPEASA